jgi:hypothetical protein
MQLSRIQSLFVGALIATQVANVVASIYLKVAMASTSPPHPVVFALYREIFTGAE